MASRKYEISGIIAVMLEARRAKFSVGIVDIVIAVVADNTGPEDIESRTMPIRVRRVYSKLHKKRLDTVMVSSLIKICLFILQEYP